MKKLVIGARASRLSRVQSAWVMESLKRAHPDIDVEFKPVATSGDRDVTSAFPVGTVGFFTKEIERALLEKEIDVAVHSLKDLPVEIADGLALAATTERMDPRDALISDQAGSLADLPDGAVIGTTSPRRIAQIAHAFPRLRFAPLRGNLDTRICKVCKGDVDAIVVAFAGLERLGMATEAAELISLGIVLPAAGQGALAVEVRAADAEAMDVCRALNHQPSERATRAERAVLRRIKAGCRAPVGVFATVGNGYISIDALVASKDGGTVIRAAASGKAQKAEQVGIEAAEKLLAAGAEELVKAAEMD